MALLSCGGGVPVWQNKNPTAGLAVGFLKFLLCNQNPTAVRRSSALFSSSPRFKFLFTQAS
jgi:hypothetical protein